MNDAIYKFDWNIDKNLLLKELPVTKKFSSLNPKWKRTFKLGEYGTKIEKLFFDVFNGKLKAGYYYQNKNIPILEHKDSQCKCCINVNLTNDLTPIIINNQKIVYNCALINVGFYRHSVPKALSNRIIFRIVFIDDNFKKVFDKITHSELIQ